MSLHLTSDPEELRKQFLSLESRKDLAELLEIEEKQLIYLLYILPPTAQYISFQIPKRTGGFREINSPATSLKIVQQKLNQILQSVYRPKAPVHGFVQQKSIVSNAWAHSGHKYILNVDLKDFFASINFGRVRGLFMSVPYRLDGSVATIVAQICCHNNQLPQGAPTSPVISNMICAKMDSQLLQLAERHGCIYTRYADDISISTHARPLPAEFVRVSETTGQVELGDALVSKISANGFVINDSKIRMQSRGRRQEVTGLTVNKFPNTQRKYVREVRAMLHALDKFGLAAAEQEYHRRYVRRCHGPFKRDPSFKQVLKGKIDFLGMVRGKDDKIYRRFRRQLWDLIPGFGRPPEQDSVSESPHHTLLILTEGKTDWKHLKAALLRFQNVGEYRGLQIEFRGSDGNKDLLNKCKQAAGVRPRQVTIHIFDRDVREVVEEAGGDEGIKRWDYHCYSLVIPIPDHRAATPDISIEFYYTDADIRRKDRNGRRLFTSDEFNHKSGRHLVEELHCLDDRARRSNITIVDSQIFDNKDENVALTKNDFADYILKGDPDFRDVNMQHFRKILDLVMKIVKDAEKDN